MIFRYIILFCESSACDAYWNVSSEYDSVVSVMHSNALLVLNAHIQMTIITGWRTIMFVFRFCWQSANCERCRKLVLRVPQAKCLPLPSKFNRLYQWHSNSFSFFVCLFLFCSSISFTLSRFPSRCRKHTAESKYSANQICILKSWINNSLSYHNFVTHSMVIASVHFVFSFVVVHRIRWFV